MTFNEAIVHWQNGEKLKREDWGYASTVYIELELAPIQSLHFYMYNQYPTMEDGVPVGYGMTYLDIISDKWKLVN